MIKSELKKKFSSIFDKELKHKLINNFDSIVQKKHKSLKDIVLLLYFILKVGKINLYEAFNYILTNKKFNRNKAISNLFILIPFLNRYSISFAIKELNEALSDLDIKKEDINLEDRVLKNLFGKSLVKGIYILSYEDEDFNKFLKEEFKKHKNFKDLDFSDVEELRDKLMEKLEKEGYSINIIKTLQQIVYLYDREVEKTKTLEEINS